MGCEYVEPYAGGASVALSLLFKDYADRVHINDLNPSVYAFWQTVLGRTEDLCERVLSVNVDVDEWHRQRAVQEQPQADVFDLGFSAFVFNRCARSGIIRGGVIGGLDQDGPWKIDARFNREDMVRRIRRIARYRDRITVTGLDTADYISDVLPGVDAPFVYLDPPYYVKGEGLYQDSYVQEDHERIAGMVESIDVPWLVSYDSAPPILEMYEGFRSISYDLNYSAQRRHRGQESMFFSPVLALPEVASPANVSLDAVDELRLARG